MKQEINNHDDILARPVPSSRSLDSVMGDFNDLCWDGPFRIIAVIVVNHNDAA